MRRAFLGSLKSASYLDMVREGLDYIRFGDIVGPSTRLFVKPNLTFPTYRAGVMTSPKAFEAALIALRDYTPHLYVGDADSGGYNPFSMDSVYEATGLRSFAERNGVSVVNLSKGERESIEFRVKRRRIVVELPTLLTKGIDYLITMPVPKIHMNTGVSLTFKNQWGCIPEPAARLRLHPFFKETILEVNKAVHARFSIVDGRFGLNDSGPMRGRPVELDWLLVTDDIGAGARVCCELMQVDLSRIPHLKYAALQGYIPPMAAIEVSQPLAPFVREQFVLARAWTDYPGAMAFRNRHLAYLAYFSPLASVLHRLLYVFREPFYDYGQAMTFDD